MANTEQQRQLKPHNLKWTAQTSYSTIETTKTIKTAPTAAPAAPQTKLVVTRVIVTITVVAAQSITIGDNSGTVIILSIPASATGQWVFESQYGEELTAGELLKITSVAGPAAHIFAEGYYD